MSAIYVFTVSSCVWVHSGVEISKVPHSSCCVVPLTPLQEQYNNRNNITTGTRMYGVESLKKNHYKFCDWKYLLFRYIQLRVIYVKVKSIHQVITPYFQVYVAWAVMDHCETLNDINVTNYDAFFWMKIF